MPEFIREWKDKLEPPDVVVERADVEADDKSRLNAPPVISVQQ